MLEEGLLSAVAAAQKLEVRLEEIRYYLKAPEYRIVRHDASVGKGVGKDQVAKQQHTGPGEGIA